MNKNTCSPATLSRAGARLLALLLALSLLSTPALARETDLFEAWPEPVDFSTLTYGEPDPAPLHAAQEALEAAMAGGGETEEILALFGALTEAMDQFYTEYTVCSVAYYRDPTDEVTQDYLTWSEALTETSNSYTQSLQTVLQSPYGAALAEELGSDLESLLAYYTPDTQEQLALLSQERELINDYWVASGVDYTVTWGDRTWTQAELNGDDTLSADQAGEVQDLLNQAFNAAAAPILVEMTEVRNAYAVSKGYDNYAAYAYEMVYGRDYTLEEARQLYAQVKAWAAPLYNELATVSSWNSSFSSKRMASLYGLTQDAVLDLAEPYMEEISSEYADLYRYMRESHLVDIAPLDTKLDVGFTTDLPSYRSALIFNCPGGSYNDVSTLVHEFGHYAEFCLSDGPNVGATCYDVSEMDSQMLEMLYLRFADEMAGEGGDAYRSRGLYNMLASVITGCLFDEFQTTIYSEGDLTVEELNALAGRLAEEYGVPVIYGGDFSDTWVVVNHTFESPMYYMSYATSALSSLELFLDAQTDFTAAADAYLGMVKLGDCIGYKEAVAQTGLTDFFQEGTVEPLCSSVRDYLYQTLCDLPAFPDLENHWAGDSANFCAACGLLEGDGSGSFLPDAPVTRAQMVTALWRMMDSPEAEGEAAAFADVPAGAWYADAVAWAAQTGVVEGVDGVRFDPDGLVTREQIAVALYRLLAASSGYDDALDGFADGAQVSGWAAEETGWAAACGLLTGKPGGLLAPQDTITRGELSALVFRLFVQ